MKCITYIHIYNDYQAISDYGAEGHKIFALVHKMDLIENIHERNLKFEQKRVELEKFAAEHGCQGQGHSKIT